MGRILKGNKKAGVEFQVTFWWWSGTVADLFIYCNPKRQITNNNLSIATQCCHWCAGPPLGEGEFSIMSLLAWSSVWNTLATFSCLSKLL